MEIKLLLLFCLKDLVYKLWIVFMNKTFKKQVFKLIWLAVSFIMQS